MFLCFCSKPRHIIWTPNRRFYLKRQKIWLKCALFVAEVNDLLASLWYVLVVVAQRLWGSLKAPLLSQASLRIQTLLIRPTEVFKSRWITQSYCLFDSLICNYTELWYCWTDEVRFNMFILYLPVCISSVVMRWVCVFHLWTELTALA